ncbi:MAG: hypothetical protein PV344_06545 [Anaplasma sp.]|nr:hypothetical protein [Anaplasma sp.]
MLTYCSNCSRDLFFTNRRRFAKFAKIRSSRKFSCLQYYASASLLTHLLFPRLLFNAVTH